MQHVGGPAPDFASSKGSPEVDDKPQKRRISQRPSLSCGECARRSDKVVPCSQCVKRGKSHLCRQELFPSHKPKNNDPPPEPQPHAITDQESARVAVFGDIVDLRTTADLLRAKISALEGVLADVFSGPLPLPAQAPPQPIANSHLSHPHQHQQQSQLQQHQQQPQPQPFFAPSDPSYGEPQVYRAVDETAALIEARPSSLDESNGGDMREESGKQAEEELEASVALEFLALGRHRHHGVTSTSKDVDEGQRIPDGEQQPPLQNAYDPSAPSAVFAEPHSTYPSYDAPPPSSYPPLPYTLFPTTSSLAASLPPPHQGSIILHHSLDQLAWHHGAVHAPSLRREVEEFWSWGERRVDVCNPAWLALYFAMLVVGVGNLAPGMAESMSLTEEDQSTLARRWFDCSMACLYRANFLQNHTVFGIQAITTLVVSGQDAAGPNLIPTLLTTGISSAQELGLHRMISDEEWEQQVRDLPEATRIKSLIGRETRKRIFWSLATQDWFRTPLQKIYVVQPTQVTTPLPINARDEDLLTGRLVNRPPSHYTVVSKLLLWIQIARCLQSIFEHIDTHSSSPSYEFLLQVDERLCDILSNAPAWLRLGGPTEGMPASFAWIRTTFLISSNHKMLTLHRPFLHRAFQDPRYETSRRRAITASRTILREAARCGDKIFRLWTIPYHITAAGCIVLLDLFQRVGSTSSASVLGEERREVEGALRALQSMQDVSAVAKRGVALITNLLSEERRLRQERAKDGIAVAMTGEAGGARGLKRTFTSDGASSDGQGEYTQAAKKMAFNNDIVSPAPSSAVSTPTSDQLQHPSPAYSANGASGAYFKHPGGGGTYANGTSPLLSGSDSAPFDYGVPPEFLSTFAESGSDWGLFDASATGFGGVSAGVNGATSGSGGGALGLEPFESNSHYLPSMGQAWGGASPQAPAGPGLPWMT